jgi:hypothetical protein
MSVRSNFARFRLIIRLENSGSDCTMGSGLRENGFNSACTVELLSE